MASEWNYKYTDKAVEDLEQIMFYISEKLSNKKAASDFLNELEIRLKNTVKELNFLRVER